MNKIRLNRYDFDEQKLHFTVNVPIKEGRIHIKDIDLGCTIYSIPLLNSSEGWGGWCCPIPKFGYDFDQENFGGFEIDLLEGDEVLERIFLRSRYTGLEKYRFNFEDGYHPTWMNYREFFVDGLYDYYDFNNLNVVVDAGASVGLFTKFALKQGAQKVIAIEADSRSIKYLNHNFGLNDKVDVIYSALSSKLGTASFNLHNNPLNSSLDVEGNDNLVKLINLESLVKKYGHINLLKLDIEGGEWDVLFNTPNEIFDSIDSILLEYHAQGGKLNEVNKKLEGLGFSMKGSFQNSNDGEFGNIYYQK